MKWTIVLMAVFVLGAAACGGGTSTTSSPDKAKTPQDASALLCQYLKADDTEAGYELLHPNTRAVISYDEFVRQHTEGELAVQGQGIKPGIKGCEVGEVTMLSNWRDPVTKAFYAEVAEVTVNMTFQSIGGQTITVPTVKHFGKAGQYWRLF